MLTLLETDQFVATTENCIVFGLPTLKFVLTTTSDWRAAPDEISAIRKLTSSKVIIDYMSPCAGASIRGAQLADATH